MKAYLSLGSNKSDREDNIRKALSALSLLPSTCIEAVSDIIETEAQGEWLEPSDAQKLSEAQGLSVVQGPREKHILRETGVPPFLNCCCRVETSLEPEVLLDALQAIEISLGRPAHAPVFNEDGQRVYSDRTIDIDILLYGGMTISTPRLQIPHPRMFERDFVMIPLQRIMLPSEKALFLPEI